jgi:hypothetical protein
MNIIVLNAGGNTGHELLRSPVLIAKSKQS